MSGYKEKSFKIGLSAAEKAELENKIDSKADKTDLENIDFNDIKNTPDNVTFAVRSELSGDTQNVAKEIEIDGTKWAIGGSNGVGSKVVANEVLEGSETELTSLTVNNVKYSVLNKNDVYTKDEQIPHITIENVHTYNDIIKGIFKDGYITENKSYVFIVNKEIKVIFGHAYNGNYHRFIVTSLDESGSSVVTTPDGSVVNKDNIETATLVSSTYNAVNDTLDGDEETLTSLTYKGFKYKIPSGRAYNTNTEWTSVETGLIGTISSKGLYEIKYNYYESETRQVIVYEGNYEIPVYIGKYAPGSEGITFERCKISMTGSTGIIINNSSASTLLFRKISDL